MRNLGAVAKLAVAAFAAAAFISVPVHAFADQPYEIIITGKVISEFVNNADGSSSITYGGKFEEHFQYDPTYVAADGTGYWYTAYDPSGTFNMPAPNWNYDGSSCCAWIDGKTMSIGYNAEMDDWDPLLLWSMYASIHSPGLTFLPLTSGGMDVSGTASWEYMLYYDGTGYCKGCTDQNNSAGGSATVDHITWIVPGSPVPEPATWAMLGLGLGAIGAAMRFARQKDRAASAAA